LAVVGDRALCAEDERADGSAPNVGVPTADHTLAM
jgi:hypothetical protein